MGILVYQGLMKPALIEAFFDIVQTNYSCSCVVYIHLYLILYKPIITVLVLFMYTCILVDRLPNIWLKGSPSRSTQYLEVGTFIFKLKMSQSLFQIILKL